jgi:hypothetical protein
MASFRNALTQAINSGKPLIGLDGWAKVKMEGCKINNHFYLPVSITQVEIQDCGTVQIYVVLKPATASFYRPGDEDGPVSKFLIDADEFHFDIDAIRRVDAEVRRKAAYEKDMKRLSSHHRATTRREAFEEFFNAAPAKFQKVVTDEMEQYEWKKLRNIPLGNLNDLGGYLVKGMHYPEQTHENKKVIFPDVCNLDDDDYDSY